MNVMVTAEEIAGIAVFAELSEADRERVLVALNFTKDAQVVSLGAGAAKVALSTDHARDGDVIDLARVELRPDEGLVVAPASR